MAVIKRERPARAHESARAKHYRYGVKWRLGGGKDGAWQSVMVGDTSGHHAQAVALNGWLKARGWNVTATDARVAELLGIDTAPNNPDADPDDEPAPTVRQLFTEYADRPKLSDGARKTYRSIISTWLGDIGPMPAATVTKRVVNAWVKDMAERGAAPKSIHGRVVALKGAIAAHAADDAFADVYTGRYKRRLDTSKVTLMSDEQIADLVWHATPSTGLALPILVAAETGIRWGEMAGLTAGMVDIERRTIRIEQSRIRGRAFKVGDLKTERSHRVVHISAELAERLALVADLPNDAPVFTNPKGEAWDYTLFRVAFLKVCKATPSVPDVVHFHDFRHSAAVRMLSRGVPIGMVSKMLGHADVKVTDEVYGQFSDDATAAVILSAGLRL